MSWRQDSSPMIKTPRTPQRSRSRKHDHCSLSRPRKRHADIMESADTPDPNASFVNPSSALLQDLLKEQRATRGARTGGLEELESSPQRTPEWSQSQSQSQSRSQSWEEPSSDKRQSTKVSSNDSIRRPAEMGVREADQVCAIVLSPDIC